MVNPCLLAAKAYSRANDWREWLNAEKEQRTLLSYPQFSSQDIDEYIDKGLKEFYLRPKQMWKMFISIRTVGDLLRKLHGFKAFVDYFFKKFIHLFKKDQHVESNKSEESELVNTIQQHKTVSL